MKHVLFIPSTNSHIPKNKLLMEEIAKLGNSVYIADPSNVIHPKHKGISQQIEDLEFNSFYVPDLDIDSSKAWYKRLLNAKKIRSVINEMYSELKPDVLVVFEDISCFCFNAVRCAKKLNIKTVLIADGVAPEKPKPKGMNKIKSDIKNFFLRISNSGGTFRGSSYPDFVLLMSKSCKIDNFKGKQIVTGAPEYDLLFEKFQSGKLTGAANSSSTVLGIPANSKVVFWPHQDILSICELEDFIYKLSKECERLDAFLLVKWHPRSLNNYEFIENKCKENGFNNVKFVKNELNSIECIFLSDVVINFFSTVSYESMILNKPSILIYTNKNLPKLRIGSGDALVAESLEQLCYLITKLLKDKEYKLSVIDKQNLSIKNELLGLSGSISRQLDVLIK